jgi:cell division protein FtsB
LVRRRFCYASRNKWRACLRCAIFVAKDIAMAARSKMTGFARFFILMLFVAPIAYIGASYYNGQDGIQNIKNLLSGNKVETTSGENTNEGGGFSLFGGSKKELETLKTENAELKEMIRERDLEIQELKREMRLLRRSQ